MVECHDRGIVGVAAASEALAASMLFFFCKQMARSAQQRLVVQRVLSALAVQNTFMVVGLNRIGRMAELCVACELHLLLLNARRKCCICSPLIWQGYRLK